MRSDYITPFAQRHQIPSFSNMWGTLPSTWVLWPAGPCWAQHNRAQWSAMHLHVVWNREVEERTETTLHNLEKTLPSSPLTPVVCWISCINCRISATTYWFSTNFLCEVWFSKGPAQKEVFGQLFFFFYFFYLLLLAAFYMLLLKC